MSVFFKPIVSLTVAQVCELTGALPINNSTAITDCNTLKDSKNSEITFFNNIKYTNDLQNTKALACFIEEKNANKLPITTIPIVVKDPHLAFTLVLQHIYQEVLDSNHISLSAKINPTAHIGENVFIGEHSVIEANVKIGNNSYVGHNTVIGAGVTIGENTIIYSNATIKYTTIGNNCTLHDGVRIGQEGFGFVPNSQGHIKIPQVGSVAIHNNVELGANTCIDRAALGETIVGDGTKIDNMVHIAHNVHIGKHCFITAGACFGGSTIIDDFVSISGNSTIAPHIRIESGSQIAGGSGVASSVPANSRMGGVPAIPIMQLWKQQALLNKLFNKENH